MTGRELSGAMEFLYIMIGFISLLGLYLDWTSYFAWASGEPGVSGDFWGSQEGCQGPSRPSGRNRGLPLTHILAWRIPWTEEPGGAKSLQSCPTL